MGRWLLFLSSWLSFATVVLSQTSEEELAWNFRGGFTGGFSASQVRGDGIEGFNKLGPYGGLIVDIRKYTNVGLQLGLLYHDKGSRKVANPKTEDYTTWAYRFTYIDIPIVAVVDIKEGYRVGTGLQPGVLLSAEEDGLLSGASTGNWTESTLPIRRWELSWVVWIGMRSGDAGEWFLRHSQSLPGIVPKPVNPGPNARWDDRMQNITLQVGYTRLLGSSDN